MSRPSQPVIALVTPTIHGETEYEQLLWEGVSQAAREKSARFLTFTGRYLEAAGPGQYRPSLFFDLARDSRIDGVLFNTANLGGTVDHKTLARFIGEFRPKPAVCLSHEIEGTGYVGIDNDLGMRQVVSHLVSNLGCRKVAFVSGPLSNPEAAIRLGAYRQVLRDAGIPADDSLVFEGDWTPAAGVRAVQHFRKEGLDFDALAGADDSMAIGAMEELIRLRVSVPDEVAVAGFDDDSSASFCTPKLTTAAQPIFEVGHAGFNLLWDTLTGSRPSGKILVPARLVVRGSAPQVRARSDAETPGLAAGSGDDLPAFQSGLEAALAGSGIPWMDRVPAALVGALKTGTEFPDKDLKGRVLQARQEEVDRAEAFGRSAQDLTDRFVGRVDTKARVSALLREFAGSVSDRRLSLTYEKNKRTEKSLNALMAANQALNSALSLGDLGKVLAAVLPRTGIDACHVVLVDNQGSDRTASLAASVGQGGPVDPQTLLPGGFHRAPGGGWAVLPLTFKGQDLGYIAFGEAALPPFVFETLANQLSTVVHRLQLVDQIRKNEAVAEDRARHIRELVLPMIRTIEESGRQARDQKGAMDSLVLVNRETSRQLNQSNNLVEGMQDHLKRLNELTVTIDDLTETINVIAINAAIAAAKAGTEGRVFSVIAAGIRNLSVQTKENTQKISVYLEELAQSAGGFFAANNQTKSLFTHLDRDVQNLEVSLEYLQTAMADLTGKAQDVIATMETA